MSECGCPRDSSGRVLLPSKQTATLKLENRRKGKTVTTIGGLDPAASDLAGLLKRLKSACGAGGTIDQGRIEVQGDQREKIAAALREIGYNVQAR
jgi:translation initiation factor 1